MSNKFTFLNVIIFIPLLFSCSKELTVPESNNDSLQLLGYPISEPYHFNTISDMILAMDANIDNVETKGNNTFVSYVDAVMSLPGYYDSPNVIYSERFGSILNAEGEVFIDNTCVKVCQFGVLYGPISKIEELRSIANHQSNEYTFTKALESPLEMTTMDGLFIFDGIDDIYVFDSFNLLRKESMDTVETKSFYSVYKTASDLFADPDDRDGMRWRKSFTYPSSSNQKQIFSCNSRVANDTKVYQTNVGIYVETGIKVKTMKKNGLGIWNKFDNPTTAILGNLAIMEYWNINFAEVENGWVGINTVEYDNRAYTVATIKINPNDIRPPMEYSLSAYINSAKSWARGLGYNVNTINAIRFVADNTGNLACVRFDDTTQTEDDGKSTIIFDFKYGDDTFTTGTPSVVGNTTVSNMMSRESHNYEVMGFFAVGYSDYNGERQGVQFNYYGGL